MKNSFFKSSLPYSCACEVSKILIREVIIENWKFCVYDENHKGIMPDLQTVKSASYQNKSKHKKSGHSDK